MLELLERGPEIETYEDIKLRQKATQMIQTLGIPAHLKGYGFLRTAIIIAVKKPEYVYNMMSKLYPAVAEIHKSDSTKVERSIRNAINVTADRNPTPMQKFFNYPIWKPTNSELIATASDRLRIELYKSK